MDGGDSSQQLGWANLTVRVLIPSKICVQAAFVLALPLAVRSAAGDQAGPIPAEDLFHVPPVSTAWISPDGQQLGAIVADENDRTSLLVYDLKTSVPTAIRADHDHDIYSFEWMGSDRLLFSVSHDRLYANGVYVAAVGRLNDYEPVDARGLAEDFFGLPEARPGRVLLQINGVIQEFDADRHINNYSSWGGAVAATQYFRVPDDGPVYAYEPDRKGDIAICCTWSKGRQQVHRFNVHHNRIWTDTWFDVPTAPTTRVMGMDFDDRFLWVVTVASDQSYELRRCNITTGALDPPVLVDPAYDISTGRLYFSKKQQRLAGVIYNQRRTTSFWFLKNYAMIQAVMDRARPATDNILLNQDDAETKFLFELTGANHPETHVILDLQARGILGPFDGPPWTGRATLHEVQPISFRTRDGVVLEGYECMPDEASPTHRVPLVVLVHGGPGARDLPEFNPEVQFLVSRGYAVLQPNYRGSSGYSPGISREDRYNFARAHRDVTDATLAFLRTGLIDRTRVGIMGASFGGYLSVAGVAFEGGLYRCAVTECGVFDWDQMLEDQMYYELPGQQAMLLDSLGMQTLDHRRLDEVSPMEHVDNIHVPVLIAHGLEDKVVAIKQSKDLARKLEYRGIPCETFFRSLEGHGFYGYQDRVDYYHLVEAFLAANLGGATLTPVTRP